jgi:uncharacterized iron-regulated membrane protein
MIPCSARFVDASLLFIVVTTTLYVPVDEPESAFVTATAWRQSVQGASSHTDIVSNFYNKLHSHLLLQQ